MINLIWDEGFKRKVQKLMKYDVELKKKFSDAVILFEEYPFDNKLKTHKLSGKLKDLWAFSIDYHYRIVFEFLDSQNVKLVDIGTHGDVY
jgi:addiction module RelE/StbE family toxin